MRCHRSTHLLMPVLVGSVLLGACAQRAAVPPVSSGPGGGGETPVGATNLQIVVTPGFLKGASVHRYRLTCDPPGGTVPDPASACQALQTNPGLLAHQRRCAMPDVGNARAIGEFRGGRVDAWFGMCGADQAPWQRLATALGIQTA
jgi:hypothetical protein